MIAVEQIIDIKIIFHRIRVNRPERATLSKHRYVKAFIMKKILVPTDFSPVAYNALEYAIEIAAAMKSELYLYHVYHIHKVDYNLDLPDDEQPVKKQLERKMNLLKLKCKNKIDQKGLTLHTIIEKDDIFSLFKRKTKEHGIDLIVMGSKGASGLKRAIFGSTAVAALEMSKVPVLVVPPDHPFGAFKSIILAMDHKETSKEVLLPLRELAIEFDSQVTVLRVHTASNKNANPGNGNPLEGIDTNFREVPMSRSINETINAFVEKEEGDLLCMIRRQKGFFEGLFQKSFTKNQAYNSRCPLLVLPEN
jgi:nucleotide-binding universal stress UspA family protein